MAADNKVAAAYHGHQGSFGYQRIVRRRMHWMCRQTTGRKVLDIGCSQGITSVLLAREGFDVLGVDVHPGSIAAAMEAKEQEDPGPRKRLRFEVTDGDLADLDELFDTIVLGEVVEHLAQPDKMVDRCVRLLIPKGRLILTTPLGVHLAPDHKEPLRPSDLRKLLASRFCLEAWEHFSWTGAANQWLGFSCVLSDDRDENWASYADPCLRLAEAGLISAQFDNAELRHKNQALTKRLRALVSVQDRVASAEQELKEARMQARTAKAKYDHVKSRRMVRLLDAFGR
ncbi:MAG: methyltransferase domain-containing protein [Chloroflexi bacterium]|nr:methyltransferase domain-containing protein [Chloroflexota bacterium]